MAAKRPSPDHHLTRHIPWAKHAPEDVRTLKDSHPAVANDTTTYPSTIINADASPRLLISGHNSRKIGGRVTKGAWAGMPIYTLTLIERATCPKDNCANWTTCYGNSMQWSRRHAPGPELERKLRYELADLQTKHPKGFVVRLHVLGDFYSVEYAKKWYLWLRDLPALHIFGYTSHHSTSEIGQVLESTNRFFPTRHLIRFSRGLNPDPDAEHTANTLWTTEALMQAREEGRVLCPTQTDKTATCGTCGLCWKPGVPEIIFAGHGQLAAGKKKATTAPSK